MDTISQNDNESVKAPVKTTPKNSTVVGESLNSAPDIKQSPFTTQKIIATAVILFLLVAIQIGPLRSAIFENSLFQTADRVADEYIDKSFKRAMIAYGTARTINALISVIQESEVHVQPWGLGVTIALGEALDPLNDMVERFSWIILVSLLSLGIQKSLVIIAPWLSISVLLNISLICMLPTMWMHNSFSDRLKAIATKTLFAALILKLAMPCVAYLNHQVYITILENQYELASTSIQQESDSLKDIDIDAVSDAETSDTEDKGWLNKAKGLAGKTMGGLKKIPLLLKKKLPHFKAKAGQMTETFIRLSIVFLLNTIVIPICFLWGLVKLGQLLIGNSFGAGLEQTFKSKIAGGKSPEPLEPDAMAASG